MKFLGFCFLFIICINIDAQVDSTLISRTDDNEHQQTSQSTKKTYTYLALGNAYTVGFSVRRNEAWPRLLSNSLTEKGMLIDTALIVAKAYWKKDLMLEVARKAVGDKEFDIVSVQLGPQYDYQEVNFNSFEKEFIASLTFAIEHCATGAAGVFVVSNPYDANIYDHRSWRKKKDKRIDRLNEICERIAADFNVPFYDITPISKQRLKNPKLVSALDKTKPSAEQYALWVKHFSCPIFQQFNDRDVPCSKLDSGYVAHQYYIEYEDLKNKGRYEKAQVSLYQAFSYRKLAYNQIANNPQLKELNFLIKNVMSDSLKYANRIESAQMALDTVDSKHWIEAERNIKLGYLNGAQSYYNEAQKFMAKPTALANEIAKRIESIPMDTVYLYDPFIHNHIDLKPQYPNPNHRFNNLQTFTKGDTLYNKRDSSLFTGVFVRGSNIPQIKSQLPYSTAYPQIGSQTFLTIKNGLIINQIRYDYNYVQVHDSLLNMTAYLYVSDIYNEKSKFKLDHLGDTINYQYHTPNGEFLLQLNANKDTMAYRHQFTENEIPIVEYVTYNSNRDTNYYFRKMHFPDSITSMSIDIDENGDTLTYNFEINERLDGLQLRTLYDTPTYNEQKKLRQIGEMIL